jgi:hypothetical protein
MKSADYSMWLRATSGVAILALGACSAAPGNGVPLATMQAADTSVSPEADEFGDSLAVVGIVWTVAMGIIQAGQPDVQAEMLQDLSTISDQISQLQQALGKLKTELDALNDAVVAQQNLHGLDQINIGIDDVTIATSKLKYLQSAPHDPNLLSDADAYSRVAINQYTNYPETWLTYGLAANISRFDPRVGWAPFLLAITTRLAFLKSQYGPTQLSSGDVAKELKAYATFIQNGLINRLDQSVSCSATPSSSGGNCYAATYCHDGVQYAPDETAPMDLTVQQFKCHVGPFDGHFFSDPIELARRNKYFLNDMTQLRDMLNNLAIYGYPMGPYVGNFGNTFTGPLVPQLPGKKVLDINGNVGNGARPVLEPWSHAKTQIWVENHDDGTIRSSVSGKCLDVVGQSKANGAAVQEYDCWGGANQKWTFPSDGTIRSVNSGKCLTVPDANTANGTALMQWDCGWGARQTWSQADPDIQLH